MMTAVVYRVASLFAPVAVLAVLGLVISHTPHSHGLSNHFGLSSLPLMGMAAGAAAAPDFEKKFQKLGDDIEGFIQRHDQKRAEQDNRLLAIEQKITAPSGGGDPGASYESVAKAFVESEQFKSMVSRGGRGTGQVNVGSFHKSNLVNATGQNQPLVQSVRVPGIVIPAGVQRLMVRDVLPQIPTTGNLIEFAKETAFTNNAAIQAAEGDAKAESAFTFALTSVAVKTIAHFLPASKQILSDANQLQAYINSRLIFGLKYKEEQELLNGSGSGTEMSGLVTQATVFDTTRTTTATDNYADVVSHALQQVRDGSNSEPTAIIMNTRDWETIRLMKATTGEYLGGGPFSVTPPTLWGKPVVATPAIALGQFLVGDFATGAAIYDRDDATVEISREHSDFFTRNLVAILAEERCVLVMYRPLAFVMGGFPYGS